jgi:hypothetical protein
MLGSPPPTKGVTMLSKNEMKGLFIKTNINGQKVFSAMIDYIDSSTKLIAAIQSENIRLKHTNKQLNKQITDRE